MYSSSCPFYHFHSMNPQQQLALQKLLWSQQQQDPLFSSGLSTLYPGMPIDQMAIAGSSGGSRFHPLSLFMQFTSQKSSGCLRVASGSLVWLFYLEAGKLAFATYSANPFERLDRHLAQVSHQVPTLVSAVRAQVRSLFSTSLVNQPTATPADYQAIEWLVEQQYLHLDQVAELIEALAKEVLESFLTLTEGTHEFLEKDTLSSFPSLCQLDLRALVDECQAQLRQKPLPIQAFSLESESKVAPDTTPIAEPAERDGASVGETKEITPSPGVTKRHTVACIDDSPTVLSAINSFLDQEYFSIVMINDPLKALMQIIRCKPDLILLDVGMPNLDGYELCSLLRKHSNFKNTPIVMVTGNTGFIDRAKAKLVGASGYLTKPFTRAELVKMVFKYLK